MDLKYFFTVFAAVFIAELGDKTQIATLLFSTDQQVSKLAVFIAASLALILATALAVIAGGLFSSQINTKLLHYIAGIGFIIIGIHTLVKA